MKGVIPELAFLGWRSLAGVPWLAFFGGRLVRVRLDPYVVVDWAQPNLTDPTEDNACVLDQVWPVSQLP
jgi:hypothetical protein